MNPSPPEYVQPAHELAVRILNELWNNWGKDSAGIRNGEVDLYNVNLPLVQEILSEAGMDVVWTTIWRNKYGSVCCIATQFLATPISLRFILHLIFWMTFFFKAIQTDAC